MTARELPAKSSDLPTATRRDLYEQFAPAQVAVSIDGREVRATVAVEAGLTVGSFAVVEAVAGTTDVVVQIRSARLDEQLGPDLEISTDTEVPGARLVAATMRPVLRVVNCAGAVVGTLADGGFRCIDRVAAFGEHAVRPARADEVERIIPGLSTARTFVSGTQRDHAEVPAEVVAKGFARHTFMCGQSGSGKTYTTGVLFERLLAETSLPLVVLDPNSDHVHLGAVADPDDTSPELRRFAAAALSVRVARARGRDADHVLCADLSDLLPEWQALLLRLHPVHDSVEYDALMRLIEGLERPYSVHDVLRVAQSSAGEDPIAASIARRIRNLGLADWQVWRSGDEPSIASLDLPSQRCVVFDLGSLPTADQREAVALAVLGNRWRRRHDRQPVLIAIDEAHNVLPATTDDPLLRAITELGVLIAGEGRKFGLHLFVATQRPAKVHPNVISQCDNLVLMRMNAASDVEDLVSSFSHVPEGMIRASTGFGLGQALLAGPISPVPSFVQVGRRFSPEGGGDVPTTWADPPR